MRPHGLATWGAYHAEPTMQRASRPSELLVECAPLELQ
jgi:hypothetical protein